MINNQAHKLCARLHLKPVSHGVAVSIQETSSQLTDELPVYNSIQQSNSEKYGLQS